jgi:hypothetical protein
LPAAQRRRPIALGPPTARKKAAKPAFFGALPQALWRDDVISDSTLATDKKPMIPLLSSWPFSKREPRPLQARMSLPAASMPRTECMPPSLVYFAPAAATGVGSAWQRLMFWLLAPAPQHTAPPPNRLGAAKREFGATLADVDSLGAEQLRWRIVHAHSLRELWHLRSEVYNAVAVTHSQFEADSRLQLLNAHFPSRAPRSQFAPL